MKGENYSRAKKSYGGLSTRHIVNVYNLQAETGYTYEIESIIDDEVKKKQGEFKTTPDVHIFNIHNVSTNCQIKENGHPSCATNFTFHYQTGPDQYSLKLPENISVEMSIPSLNIKQASVIKDDGSRSHSIGSVFAKFSFPIESDGTYLATFSVSNQKYNYGIVATSIDIWKNNQCNEIGAFCDSKDVAWPDATPYVEKSFEYKKILLSPGSGINYNDIIGSLKISGVALSSFSVSNPPLKFDKYDASTPSTGSGNNRFTLRLLGGPKPGIYSYTVTDIDVYGRESGKNIKFSGLPVTFTFEVIECNVSKDIRSSDCYVQPARIEYETK